MEKNINDKRRNEKHSLSSGISRSKRIFSGTLLYAMSAVLLLVCSISLQLDAQDGESFDKVIEVGVKPGQMLYDIEEFSVPAGGKVKLVFDNTDGTLQHNVVILVQGDEQMAIKFSQEAWSMQNPIQNDYVPDSETVLYATSLLSPGEKESITFEAPEEPGDYPYVCTMPGHAMTMNGMMHVKKADTGSASEEKSGAKAVSLTDLSYTYYEGTWDELPEFRDIESDKQGTLSEGILSLDARERDQKFGFVFEGTLQIPQTGTYHILLISNGDAHLLLDGKSTLRQTSQDQPGVKLHGVKLERGTHPYRLDYLQKTEEPVLKQLMITPAGKLRPLSKLDQDE